jgi:hypothetical protein
MIEYFGQKWKQLSEMDIFARLSLLFAFFLSWQAFGIPNTFIISDALVLITFGFLVIKERSVLFKYTPLEKGMFIFLLCISGTLLIHHEWVSIKEIIKFYYLVFLTIVMTRAIFHSKEEKEGLIKGMVIAMIIGALLSIALSLLMQYVIGMEVKYIDEKESFPYFGQIYRIKAFTAQPGNLATILSIGIIFLWHQKFQLKKWILALAFLALIMTFSKTGFLVCLVILISMIGHLKMTLHNRITFSSILLIGGILFYILPTVLRPVDTGTEIPKPEQYQYGKAPILSYKGMDIYPSVYYFLKTASKELVSENLLKGVGPAKFNTAIDELKKQGQFPKHIPSYSPHDSYLGTAVEYGLPGIIGFSILFFTIIQMFIKQKNSDPLIISIGACILFILLHGLMTDSHHFRHFWLVLVFLNMRQIKIMN